MKTLLAIVFLLIQGVSSLLAIDGFPWVLPTPKPPSSCSERYGNPPAKRTTSLNGLLSDITWCVAQSGRIANLKYKDNNGDQRQACLFITSSTKPLPLLVWLHASLLSPASVSLTNLIQESKTGNLTGVRNGPLGYHLLVPLGRDTAHMYPAPDDKGLGWDNWYRNYNRSDPALNVDAQTIDYFINAVKQRTDLQVDVSRVYMSGWSNGGAMALQYALNTPGIAAAAVYSAPDPYRDYKDPCAQTPKPTQFTPVLVLYNQCDILDLCQTGKAFINDLNNRYADQLVAKVKIIDSLLLDKTTCNTNCKGIFGLGAAQHLRWPITLNSKIFFSFLRQYTML